MKILPKFHISMHQDKKIAKIINDIRLIELFESYYN